AVGRSLAVPADGAHGKPCGSRPCRCKKQKGRSLSTSGLRHTAGRDLRSHTRFPRRGVGYFSAPCARARGALARAAVGKGRGDRPRQLKKKKALFFPALGFPKPAGRPPPPPQVSPGGGVFPPRGRWAARGGSPPMARVGNRAGQVPAAVKNKKARC